MKKIDFGCGMIKKDGWIGVDIREYPNVDYKMNIGKEKLPFKDNEIDEAKAIHLLEHLYPEELFFFMDEVWRVLKPDCFFHIEVPEGTSGAYYINPDHKIHFIKDTFGFFLVPDNEGHVDPHGYLKGHWRIEFIDQTNIENISVNMYPNKEGSLKFPYVKVIRPYEKGINNRE